MGILSQLSFRSAQLLIPYQVTLELTYRCNERCGHCYLTTYDDAEDGRPPLRLEDWQKVLDQLAQAGAMLLVLIGGEAMLHPDFWKIAEYAAAKGFALSLITNGLLLDEKAALRMRQLGFYQVAVSLYSLRAGIHDRMTRRKGSHGRTLAAIGHLKAQGIDVGVNCLLTSENIDTALELADWGQAQGILVRFDPLVTAKANGDLKNTVTRTLPEQVREFYRKRRARGELSGPQIGAADDPVCNQARGKCAVNAYGDLLSCLEVRDPIGNLRENHFQELWHSPKAQALRAPLNQDLRFDPTQGDGAYCEHCPGMAKAETGDPLAPVPFLMELAQIRREVLGEKS